MRLRVWSGCLGWVTRHVGLHHWLFLDLTCVGLWFLHTEILWALCRFLDPCWLHSFPNPHILSLLTIWSVLLMHGSVPHLIWEIRVDGVMDHSLEVSGVLIAHLTLRIDLMHPMLNLVLVSMVLLDWTITLLLEPHPFIVWLILGLSLHLLLQFFVDLIKFT